jgi:2',3'-cyclic-nucleotide 2'-phosphodiesterase (5'-nucleotidase family)
MRGLLRLVAVLALFVPSVSAANISLTVFHTNDIHGWIMPRTKEGRRIGGMAAAAALVKKTQGPKLVLDAGDWFQGTPEGTLSRGRALVDLFNALPYDAVAPGNHEFDFGEENLRILAKSLKPPLLAANIYRQSDGQRVPYARPWMVKTVAGIKVGLFGLVTSRTKSLSFPGHTKGLEFRREVSEAKAAVQALRAQGATVVIALTHVGFEKPDGPAFEGDQTLASEVEGIDLIVGGHTHTFLKEPLLEATHGTLIVQAGTGLTSLGKVVLEIEPAAKNVVSSRGRLVDLWLDETGEDPAVAALVAGQERAVSRAYDVVVGTATSSLLRNAEGESSLGSWMTDCLRGWAGTQTAFQNGGGIRADLSPGPVTVRHLFNVMPFDNRVVKLKMKGRHLKEVVDHGVGARGMLQASGIEARYRRREKPGHRLESLSVAGGPVEEDRVYTAAALDFMVKGGDGFTPFELAEDKEETKTFMRDVLRWCAEKKPLIEPPAPGRLRPLGD